MAEEDDDEDGGDEDVGVEQVREEEVEEELEEEDSSEEDGSGDEVPSVAAPVAPATLPARGGARCHVAAVPAAHRLCHPAARPSAPALSGGGTGGHGRGADR